VPCPFLSCPHWQDLEPFSGKYVQPLLTFIRRLSSNLRSPERNCVSETHPLGRSITMFMFASAVTPEVWAALGPNGFVTVSGYDLSDAPPGTPSTVAFYAQQLTTAMAAVAASARSINGTYFVGIPAAASTHEFESFTWANGTVVKGFAQVRALSSFCCNWNDCGQPPALLLFRMIQIDYVSAALGVLKTFQSDAGFLGAALWGFSSEMECECCKSRAVLGTIWAKPLRLHIYCPRPSMSQPQLDRDMLIPVADPPHSANHFDPSNPFVDAGEEAYLEKNL
jgi:hypothetical protein